MVELLKQIDVVLKTGQVNELDRFLVISQCKKFGYMDAAKWISENPRDYAKFITGNTDLCLMPLSDGS